MFEKEPEQVKAPFLFMNENLECSPTADKSQEVGKLLEVIDGQQNFKQGDQFHIPPPFEISHDCKKTHK